MRRRIPILSSLMVLMGLFAWSPAVLARTDGAPARALGMADAVRALGFGTSGLYFNPAAMSQVLQYAIDFGYGHRAWDANDSDGMHNGHVAFVDSQTNPELAGGASYTFSGNTDLKTQIHDFRLAVSSSYRNDRFMAAYGVGYRYFNLQMEDPSLDRAQSELDVGFVFGFWDILYVGIAGQNLLQINKDEIAITTDQRRFLENPDGNERVYFYAPRTLGFGVGVVYSILHLGVDVEVAMPEIPEGGFGNSGGDWKTKAIVSPSVGLELTLGGAVALRAGYMYDRMGDGLLDPSRSTGNFDTQHRVTFGMGYVSNWVGVDIGAGLDASRVDKWLIESSIRVFLP